MQALESELGHSGYVALLNHVELPQFLQTSPPDNLERNFDFAHVARLNRGLEVLYGPRGARNLATRSGRVFFSLGLKKFGILASIGDLTLRAVPLATKLKMGLSAVARVFTQVSDQTCRSEEMRLHFVYHIEQCPVCWGRSTREPIDHFHVGTLQEAMRWIGGNLDFRVTQTKCRAMGDVGCAFRIDKEPIR